MQQVHIDEAATMATEAARFIAHPVSKGDAFELCWGTKRILVDGGQYPDEVQSLLDEPQLDAVFCTHGDADHALGLVEILKKAHTKELWIPATWKSVCAHAIELVRKNGPECWPLTELDEAVPLPEDDVDTKEDGFFDADLDLESISGLPTLCPCRLHFLPHSASPFEPLGLTSKETAHDTYLEAYHRIVELIRTALIAGVPIRTLEYERRAMNVSIPGLPELRAHNASLGRRIKRYPSLLRAVQLSRINRHSLTLAFANGDACVFFCGDSNLGYAKSVDLQNHTLVTVPHHGSPANGVPPVSWTVLVT